MVKEFISNPTCVYLTILQSLVWLQSLSKHWNSISLSLGVIGNQGLHGLKDESEGLCPRLHCINILWLCSWRASGGTDIQRNAEDLYTRCPHRAQSSAVHISGSALTIVSYVNAGWIMHGCAPHESLCVTCAAPPGLTEPHPSCSGFLNLKTTFITWKKLVDWESNL